LVGDNPQERGQQATSYPSLISGIYNSVQQMLRLHLDACVPMPPDVRIKIEQLKSSCSSRGGRKQYWIDSAKRLGLVDTPHGIHFGRDPTGPLPPLSGPSVNSKEARTKKQKHPSNKIPSSPDQDNMLESNESSHHLHDPNAPYPHDDGGMSEEEEGDDSQHLPDEIPSTSNSSSAPSPLVAPIPPVEDRPLVFPVDKSLISDYLYLTLEQMAPCLLMEVRR
jgi:hypothetical protein